MDKLIYRAISRETYEYVYSICILYDIFNTNNDDVVYLNNAFKTPIWENCIKSTLGRYSGLKDINTGVIFEGDLLCDYDGKEYKVMFEDGSYVITTDISGHNALKTILKLSKENINNYKLKVVGNTYQGHKEYVKPTPLLNILKENIDVNQSVNYVVGYTMF